MGKSHYACSILARLDHMGVFGAHVRHTAWSHGRVTLAEWKNFLNFEIYKCVQFSLDLFLMHVYGHIDLRKGLYVYV